MNEHDADQSRVIWEGMEGQRQGGTVEELAMGIRRSSPLVAEGCLLRGWVGGEVVAGEAAIAPHSLLPPIFFLTSAVFNCPLVAEGKLEYALQTSGGQAHAPAELSKCSRKEHQRTAKARTNH